MEKIFNEYFELNDCELTFDAVLKDKNLTPTRVNELQTSQMLFLPAKNHNKNDGYCFYSATRDFYLYSKKENPNNHFDFCVEKDNYQEIALNSYELFLGTLIIKDVVLPFFVSLISNYVYDKLKSDDNICVNIIVTNDKTNKSQEISFRGTRDDFKEKVVKTLQTYSREGKFTMLDQKGIKIDVLS
jgi:hypothetical protein